MSFRAWMFRWGRGPCELCGAEGELHHVTGRRNGDAANVVWLCRHHHTGGAGVHKDGQRTFARRNRICLPGLALLHYAAYLDNEQGLAR